MLRSQQHRSASAGNMHASRHVHMIVHYTFIADGVRIGAHLCCPFGRSHIAPDEAV